MDENFNPNRSTADVFSTRTGSMMGKGGTVADQNLSSIASSGEATRTADMDASFVGTLAGLQDGQVAVVGDLVAIRAGPETYHPIKAIKVMKSNHPTSSKYTIQQTQSTVVIIQQAQSSCR